MKGTFRAFPVAVKMLFTDPVNFVLAVIPTLIALAIYLLTIIGIYKNTDHLISLFRNYVYDSPHASVFGYILTAILIIFVFFVMSWTFIIVVGIISAPFNSLLSARIEEKLTSRVIMDEDQDHAIAQVKSTFVQTLKNEAKKMAFLLVVGAFAFLLNLVPILYPVAVFLIATLLAVQFVDYSWSRHEMSFGACLKDVASNIVHYFISGAIFLALVAIPLVNALVPALATSYFTVLWLYRQKKIDL